MPELNGVRDSSRASRSGGGTRMMVSLIGEGFGVACGAMTRCAGARRRLDRAGRRRVGQGGERGGAGLQQRLAARDLIELGLELLLVEQLPACQPVDLAAQIGDAVLVGELHLRLAGEEAGQHVVAEREIGGGHGRPSGHHHQRPDDDPERDRADAHLPAGMADRPAGPVDRVRLGRELGLRAQSVMTGMAVAMPVTGSANWRPMQH